MGELSRRGSMERFSLRESRAAAQRSQEVIEEIRLRALMADGVIALTEHLMDGVRELDMHRRALAHGDPTLNALLSEFEARAVVKLGKVQAQAFNPFGF